VPENFEGISLIGRRVIVEFGGTKQYSALVVKKHQNAPKHYVAKPILSVLDDISFIRFNDLDFWLWIARYYFSSPGEVMLAALPAGFKLASESRIALRSQEEIPSELSSSGHLLIDALSEQPFLTLSQVRELLNVKSHYRVVHELMEQGIIEVFESIRSTYKPQLETYIQLTSKYISEEQLQGAFDLLNRAPRQLEILMAYLELSRFFSGTLVPVKKSELLKKSRGSGASLKGLINKNIIKESKKTADRLAAYHTQASSALFQLTVAQEKAYQDIKDQWKKNDVVLLHGVTSSGKTEIFFKLIRETLDKGSQVLYLLPEIALTTQIIDRMQQKFGENVGVFHSRMSQNERYELWMKMRSDQPYPVVLGARSSVFVPIQNLGLVIVDEEHDSSFKQFDPAPRYHGRDSAIMLAKMRGAKVLLGSATPSVESMYHAKTGKYGLVSLTERYGGIAMPEVQLIDLRDSYKRKKMKGSLSFDLASEMHKVLKNGRQVILFQNRRGFSPFIQCRDCGWSPHCERCDVSLTYHKFLHRLKCHYCGFEQAPYKLCPACGSEHLMLKGQGTEKIEEEVAALFPEYQVARMDWDTTRGKSGFQKLINRFAAGDIDILVGTQMVTKGLDFERVKLVGILQADQSLNIQHYRSNERTFQQIAQVSGRAGRKGEQGKVIIQAFKPEHPIIQMAARNNFDALYELEFKQRNQYVYPPFVSLYEISVRHRERDKVIQGAMDLGKILRKDFGNRVLGPEFPVIAKVRNFYIMNMLLKIEKGVSQRNVKVILHDRIAEFKARPATNAIRVVVDVDSI
jgi:primosomal protein N' (replication factor Y)